MGRTGSFYPAPNLQRRDQNHEILSQTISAMKKEIPILFSTIMVQAIVQGRKTQTRRIMKPQPDFQPVGWKSTHSYEREARWKRGDILWVRESWQWWADQNQYKADQDSLGDIFKCPLKFKPSIHMPKSAARIWLEVEDVRVERLRDISAWDAGAEGVNYWNIDRDAFEGGELVADYENYEWRDDPKYEDYNFPHYANPVASFFSLWRKIHGKESFEANPWVYAISFKVLSTKGKPSQQKTGYDFNQRTNLETSHW
jgi:hypothetical protein